MLLAIPMEHAITRSLGLGKYGTRSSVPDIIRHAASTSLIFNMRPQRRVNQQLLYLLSGSLIVQVRTAAGPSTQSQGTSTHYENISPKTLAFCPVRYEDSPS